MTRDIYNNKCVVTSDDTIEYFSKDDKIIKQLF